MTEYKIYIYTRFSLPIYQTYKDRNNLKKLSKNPRAPPTFNSYEEYIEYLYSNDRLEKKLFFFETLTLKTILSQTYKNYNWIIFISNLLPDKYKAYLKNIENYYNNISIYEIKDLSIKNINLSQYHKAKEESFLSSRIDDDDGLCPNYFDILVKDFQTQDYDVIGSKSCLLISKNENRLYSSNMKYPYLMSCGLTTKNRNIFDMGSHTNIHEKYKSLNKNYDNTKNYCLISCGDHTITSRSQNTIYQNFDIESYINNE